MENVRAGQPKYYSIFQSPQFLLMLILFLSIGLRFFELGKESYWIDEMSTVIEGQQSLQQLFTSGRLDQPPAYYVPFHFWVKVLGTSEVSTRAFSAVFGIGSIVLIYFIGKDLFGDVTGLLSAFFMTISEYQIYFSQEARYYTFFGFMTLLSFYFFIPVINKKKPIYIILYCTSSILMITSHAFGIFVLAAQNLYILLNIKNLQKLLVEWMISQAAILAGIIPYFYPMVFGDGGVVGAASLNIGNMAAPSLFDPVRSIYRILVPPRMDQSWGTIIFIYILAVIVLLGGTWIYSYQKGFHGWIADARGSFDNYFETQEVRSRLLLVFLWLVCPILIPFILSFILTPMYQDRYMVSAAPAAYLLLAFSLVSFRKVVPLIVSTMALLILMLPGLSYYYSTNVHEPWKEAASYVEARDTANQMIVFAPNMGIGIQQKTFDWYYDGVPVTCGLSPLEKDPNMISENLVQCVTGYHQFWVVVSGSHEFIDFYQTFFSGYTTANINLINHQVFAGQPEIIVYLFNNNTQ